MRREALWNNPQSPFSESYSSLSQKRSRTTLERNLTTKNHRAPSIITKDSSSKLTYIEKNQLNEKGITNSIIDIYPVEYWREFLRPKSIEELKKRERERKGTSYVDSSTPLLSDVANN